MSLGGLHNPKRAAEKITEFRKRFSTKVCMCPLEDHFGPIVSAHTMSLEAVLRPISVSGHVYAPPFKINPSDGETPIQLKRLGLRDVSVFNGFCQKHDAELFSCIENRPFRFEPEQIFKLAYRAAARDCYMKRKQCESMPTLEDLKEIHGIEEAIEYSEESQIFQAGSLVGAEEIEALKHRLDAYFLKGAWGRLVTKAILFSQRPSIAASFCFQPHYDMNGVKLQEYEDYEAEMSHIFINLMPLEQGGAAVFSWLDTSNSAPRRFFDSVISVNDLTSSVIHAVLDNGENIAVEPNWYEALSEPCREYLVSRMAVMEASIVYADESRPDRTAPFLDEWGSATVSSF